jgi:glycosyltransferase involved in cell wall biosynthesis
MKLLIYCSSFFPAIGGTERVTFDLAQGIATWTQNGAANDAFAVTVVTQTPGKCEQDKAMPFRMIRRPGLRGLFSLIRASDLLHLAGPAMAPLVLGLAAGKPIVVEHHGFQTVCPNGQYFYSPEKQLCEGYFMEGRIGKCIACNSADYGAAGSIKMLCSTPVRRWLSNRAGVNITPTQWLSSVIRLRHMDTVFHGSQPPAVCDDLRTQAVPTFAFQGRLVSTKGASVLVEAARLLHDQGAKFGLKIIGDGPERSKLQAEAASLGNCIEFIGHVPDERLSEVYSDVSIVVVPSLAGEVFGLVAAENMLRGKALIVSDIGSLKEIAGEAAVAVRAGNASELAAAMRRFLQGSATIPAMGQKAKERAQRVFDMETMIRSHVEIYRRVAKKPALAAQTHRATG